MNSRFTGPVRLYEKAGIEVCPQAGNNDTMQKKLKEPLSHCLEGKSKHERKSKYERKSSLQKTR